jgi:hypothetical protein
MRQISNLIELDRGARRGGFRAALAATAAAGAGSQVDGVEIQFTQA